MVRTWLQITPVLLCLLLTSQPPAAADTAPAPRPVAAQDSLVGNGTPGPYPLSWTQVRFGSEQLSVNGTRLCPALDYDIDDGAGTITFTQPLQLAQIARVDYVYDAARATHNQGLIAVPLSLRVWGSGSGGLQMIGAVAPDGSATGSALGFRAETALGGSQISSVFLLAPDASGRSSAASWQTAALQFGASRTRGPFQFHGSISQASAGFNQANNYQLQQGLRVLDFSAAFNPSRGFSFTTQVNRQDALDASQKTNEQASTTNQLTLTPASGTKLIVSQESSRTAQAQGPAQTADALRAQLVQSLGSTTATLLAEQQHTSSSGTTTTTGLDVASHLTPRTQLTAGFVQNDNSQAGRDRTVHAGLDAQATPQLRLHTDFSHRDSVKDGQTDTLGFGLNAGTKGAVDLEGGYAWTQAAKAGSDTASHLTLTVKPADQLGFHLGFKQDLNTKQGSASGMTWGVSAGRRGLIAVEGNTNDTLSAAGPAEHDEQLTLSTAPLRGLKVAEVSAAKQIGTAAALETQETSLELSPLRALDVTGAFGEEPLGTSVAQVRSVSGFLQPAPFLHLSGAYKIRNMPARDSLVTRDVSLALIPVHGFKLQGSYVENPEGPDGQVQNGTDNSLSLDSAIGSFSFGGSFTEGAGSNAAPPLEQSEFRLGLSLWGHTRLYSDYKTSEERAASLTENQTLSLGLTRALSDHFYLLLEGDLTEVQVNGVPQPGMTDQRAQAKLALRF